MFRFNNKLPQIDSIFKDFFLFCTVSSRALYKKFSCFKVLSSWFNRDEQYVCPQNRLDQSIIFHKWNIHILCFFFSFNFFGTQRHQVIEYLNISNLYLHDCITLNCIFICLLGDDLTAGKGDNVLWRDRKPPSPISLCLSSNEISSSDLFLVSGT